MIFNACFFVHSVTSTWLFESILLTLSSHPSTASSFSTMRLNRIDLTHMVLARGVCRAFPLRSKAWLEIQLALLFVESTSCYPALRGRNYTRYFTPTVTGYLLTTEKGLFSGTPDKAGARKQLAVVSSNSSSLYRSVSLFPPVLSSEQRLSGRGRLAARAAQPPWNSLFPHPHDLAEDGKPGSGCPCVPSLAAHEESCPFLPTQPRGL